MTLKRYYLIAMLSLLIVADYFIYSSTMSIGPGIGYFLFAYASARIAESFFNIHLLQRWFLLGLLALSLIFDMSILNLLLSLLLTILWSRGLNITELSKLLANPFKPILTYFRDMIHISIQDILTTAHDLKIDKKTIKDSFIKTFQWGIALCFGIIFISLFALANPIIELYLKKITSTITTNMNSIFQIDLALRLSFMIAIGFLVWGLFYAKREEDYQEINKIGPAISHVGFIKKCLIIFNFVFLVEIALDFYYLFGSGVLPQGMTYASYAHRGAYPLIAVTLISGIFVSIVFQKNADSSRDPLARILVYLWLIQNVLLTIFTLTRLVLYVDQYHLTYWRVATFIWLFLIGCGFLICFARIYLEKTNDWLFRTNISVVLFVFFCCSFFKFGSFIGYYNATHCREITGQGAELDILYIDKMGTAAIPAYDFLAKNKNSLQTTAQFRLKALQIKQYNKQLIHHWYEITLYDRLLFWYYF